MSARMRQMNAVITYTVMLQRHDKKLSAQTLIVGICDACSRMPAQIFIMAVVALRAATVNATNRVLRSAHIENNR